MASKTAAAKTTAPKTMAAAKKKSPAKKKKNGYSTGDFVVYPTHGVGKITGIEKQEIAGFNLELFVIRFASEKM
ncbi:MAG: CarD family transcriptional regulator, partial [Alphaproteobacteria bacterium]